MPENIKAFGERWQRFIREENRQQKALGLVQPKPQLVYFIQAQSGPIKIGIAQNPKARLGDLQIANHEPLTLLAAVVGGAALERALHAEFLHLHIHGEWFRVGSDLLARIDALTASPEIKSA